MQLPLIFCSVATLLATCWASDQDKQPEVGTALAAGNFLYSRLRRHALLGLPRSATLSFGDDKNPKSGRGLKKRRKNSNLLGRIADISGVSFVRGKEEDSKESTEQEMKQDQQAKTQGRAAEKSTAAPPITTQSVNVSTSTAEESKVTSVVETTVQVPSTTDTTVQETLSTTENIVEETSTTVTTTQETSTTTPETSTAAPETSATAPETSATEPTTEGTPATTLAPDQISTSEDSTGAEATDKSGSMKLVKSESRSQAGAGSVQEAGQESRAIGGDVGNLFDQKLNQMQALLTFDQLAGQDPGTPKPANAEDAYAILPPISYSPSANPSVTYKELIRQLPDHQMLPDNPRSPELPAYPSWSNKPIPSAYSSYLDKKTGPSEFEALYRANKLPAIAPPRTPNPPKPATFDYDAEDPFFAG